MWEYFPQIKWGKVEWKANIRKDSEEHELTLCRNGNEGWDRGQAAHQSTKGVPWETHRDP